MDKKSDSEVRKEKKNRDRLSYTIIGVVLYSVILIAVMAGSYVGVKSLLKKHPPVVNDIVEEEQEHIAEATPTPTPTPKPVQNDNKVQKVANHDIELAEVIDSETGCVDFSNRLFKPARRDNTLKWEDNVFSRIENIDNPQDSPVNSFFLKRISVNLADQKTAEYKAYIDLQTAYIEKIIEVIDCGTECEVNTYYYNEGCINYISSDRMQIDKPVPLTSSDIESRYYFNNDVLVRFVFCDGASATEYTVADLKNYSEGTVAQYDYLEDDMINRSYIVYNLARQLNDTQILYGYVLDEFSMPIEDAEVVITNDTDGKIAVRTQTDGDGYYKAIVSCDSESIYTVTANKETLNTTSVYGITAYQGALKYAVDPIYMNYSQNGGVYNVAILVRDALDTNKSLAEATIKLRHGINNKEGDVIAAGTLDATGMAVVPMLAGSYTAEVSKGGYETSYFPVIVRVDHLAAVGFAVPDVKEDTYVAVLSWETTPLDLDFKAVATNQSKVIKSFVDSIGSTTTEAVVLDRAREEDYRLYVSDYGSIANNDPLAYSLTGSSAIVYIYSPDGQIASLHVPVASAGVVWEPCEIFGGNVLPENKYYYTIENDPLWLQK